MQVNDSNRNRRSMVVVAVACALLQLALVPNVGIANGRANLALVAASALALQIGGRTTVAFGFCAGLFFDLTTTGPVGLMAFELTLAALFLGSEQRNRLAEDWGGSVQVFCVAALAVELVYGLAMLLVGQATDLLAVLGLRTLPSLLLDVVAFLLVGMLAQRLSGPSGQPSFGGGSKPFLGGRHGRAARAPRLGRKGL